MKYFINSELVCLGWHSGRRYSAARPVLLPRDAGREGPPPHQPRGERLPAGQDRVRGRAGRGTEPHVGPGRRPPRQSAPQAQQISHWSFNTG